MINYFKSKTRKIQFNIPKYFFVVYLQNRKYVGHFFKFRIENKFTIKRSFTGLHDYEYLLITNESLTDIDSKFLVHDRIIIIILPES